MLRTDQWCTEVKLHQDNNTFTTITFKLYEKVLQNFLNLFLKE